MLSRPRQTGGVNQQYEVCHIDVFRSRDENFTMSIPKLIGNLFRAGRAFVALGRGELPDRLALDTRSLYQVARRNRIAQHRALTSAPPTHG
jgi:hypothetical protein